MKRPMRPMRLKRRNPPSTRKRATRAPQGTPPGFPFPCDDPMVGQKVSGKDFAGRVVGCATPPPGKRGRFMFVGGGAVSVGRVSSAEKASARVRQELAERWDGDPPARPIRRQTRQTRQTQPVARPMLQLPAPRPQWVDPRLLVPGALPFMPTPMPRMAKPPVAVLDTPPRGVRTVAPVSAPSAPSAISPPSWLDLSRVAVVASTRSIDISAPADRKHAKDLATWLGMMADIVANSLPAGEASILPAVSVPKEKRVAATVRVRTAESVQAAVSAAAAVLGRMGRVEPVSPATPVVQAVLEDTPRQSGDLGRLTAAILATSRASPTLHIQRSLLDRLGEWNGVARLWKVKLTDGTTRTVREFSDESGHMTRRVDWPKIQKRADPLAGMTMLTTPEERFGAARSSPLAVPPREPWFAPSPAIEPGRPFASRFGAGAPESPRPFGSRFGAGTPDPARIPDAPPPVAAVAVGAALSQDPAAKQTGGRKWSPLQMAIFDAVANDTRNIVVMARAGTGKCLGKGTPVMLFDGTIKPVEDIVDGDLLMGPDSKPRTVQSTSTGRGPLYVVNPIKGEPWVCNDVHILTLRHAHTREVRDIALPDVLSLVARDPEHPWRIFKAIVHLPDRPFTVSPLGIGDYYGFTLDGDGRFLLGDFTVTHNTTTIIEALLHVPPGKRSLLVAFNSAIRDELKRRAPDSVSVRTLHQHGFMCIRRYWGGDLKVGTNAKDGDGVRSPDKIRRDNMLHATGAPWWRSFSNDPDGWNEELKQLLKLIDLCKGTLANTPAKIRALQEEFELLVVEGDPAKWRFRLSEPKRGEPKAMDGNTVIEWVQRALAFSLTPPGPDRCVSFDDMVFVPASLPNMEPERYDFVFVDETQDMNAAQLVLVRKSMEPGGRIVIVGDDRQCIAVTEPVLTPVGLVTAGALAPGDMVLSYRNGKNTPQRVSTIVATGEKDCVTVVTRGGRTLTMSLEHRIWASPPTVEPGQHFVYLMYRPDKGFRVGVTNSGYRDVNQYGNRMVQERASRLWVLDRVSDREEALQLELAYSLAYGIPTLVFEGARRGLNQHRIDAVFADFGQNGSRLLDAKGYKFDMPHWLQRTGRHQHVVYVAAHGVKGTIVALEGDSLDAATLKDSGHRASTRPRGGVRIRRWFTSHRDAEAYARDLADATGAAISWRLTTHGELALQLINAGSLLPGMHVAVRSDDGVVTDPIATIAHLRAACVDLEINDANNFYAGAGGGMLSHNSIYGWRGADTEAMERMRRELDARLLPLSISYRVPGCSATEARKVVSDFSVPEFTPDGQPWPEGLCQSITAMRMVDLWRDGDFVITRVNRVIEPLVKLAVISGLNPLALGMGDLMRGVRDVLVAGMRGRPASTADLLVAIDKWSEREEQRIEGELQRKREKYGRKYDRDLGENGEPEELVNLHLNVDAAKALIKRYDGDMDAIKQRLDSLAISEKDMEKASPDQIASALKGRLVISSVHRIKGQESNRTWVLEDTFRYSRSGHKPPPRGKTDSEKRKREEENLWYVAITRVKNEPGHPGELYYVGRIKELLGV